MLGRRSGQTWQRVGYLLHGEWLLALFCRFWRAGAFVYARRYLRFLHSGGGGFFVEESLALRCVPGHMMHDCPSQGHWLRAQCWRTSEGHRRRRRVPIAPKDFGVGGVKWLKESVRSCLLKRISIGWFHPFLAVPVASVVRWLLRMSLVSANAGWGCVSCVVHLKACLLPL